MRWTRGARMPAAFWLALMVLVVNDHVLKGSGLLPGLVTGKLSDFAGLVVAPLLLCALSGARSDRVRYACIALVALPFVAIKLSPWAASAVADALSLLVPSRIWCDPTDLIALSVLPWTARLAQRVEPIVLARPWPRRVGLALAALACIATSEDGPQETKAQPPFLINWTHQTIEVEVVRRLTPCSDAGDAGAEEPIVERIWLPVAGMVELGAKSIEGAEDDVCAGSAEVRIGEVETRVAWRSSELGEMDEAILAVDSSITDAGADRWLVAHDDAWFFERAVTVIGSPDAAQLDVGRLLDVEGEP